MRAIRYRTLKNEAWLKLLSRLRRFLSFRKTRWRRWVIGALSLPVLVLVGLLALRAFTQRSIARNTRITSPDGIESLEAVSIGGVTQWLLIRGQDRRNPVLLFLHGGPGSASMALSPKHDTPLLRHFTVVHWDQRGAGKSFGGVSPESLTVERFVADIREVVIHLRQRLGADPVYLVGHSWGSKIGALAAARFPELFEAFVGVGQAVGAKGDSISYAWLLDRASQEGNQKAERTLKDVGPPPWTTLRAASVSARYLAAFGGTSQEFPILDYYLDLATSPAYSLADLVRFVRGMRFSVSTMLANGELGAVDLIRDAARIDVPVFFFQGRHDHTTPGEHVAEYFESLDAPAGKTLVWFEHSAHLPHWEEPERFLRELLRVRSTVQSGAAPRSHGPGITLPNTDSVHGP